MASLKIIQCRIERFSKAGNGVGSLEVHEGLKRAAEVPFTIPGDVVKAQLMRKKKGVYNSRLEEIVEPSPDRIPSRCKHFGLCGGCRWQQMSYEHQLELKQLQIRKHFEGLISEEVQVNTIIPCDEPWHYRNKMEFSFSSDRHGERYLGLFMDGGRGKVFHLWECHLPNPWLADAVKAARQWWEESGLDAYRPLKNTGLLQTLTLREGINTGDRMINLTVSGNPDYAPKRHHLNSFIASMRSAVEPVDPEKRLSIFLTIKQIKKGHPTRFYEMHLYGSDHIREILTITPGDQEPPLSLAFKISSSAFFQPNTKQAEKLYSAVLRMAELGKEAVVYDLYCGTGTLGLCAAKCASQVVGIELSRESSLDARENAKENGLANVTILTGSVEEKLAEIHNEKSFPFPHLVVVDPPRAGLEPKALQQIIGLCPEKIAYVSCNPATQAANIAELIKAGYKLTALQPVDQFPHTIHIENIAILKRLET